MRIDSTKSRREDSSRIKSGKPDSVKQKSAFNTILGEKIGIEFSGAIDQLIFNLKEEEEQFLKDQSLYQMHKYKAIVEKILKMITDESYETFMLKRRRRGGTDFLLVKEINSKLLNISREITGNNRAFNLLKELEEVRGLILDLVY